LIENVKELRPELKCFGFTETEILDGRKIPLGKSRAFDNIAPFIAKAFRLTIGLKLLEGEGVKPFGCRVRAGVWIADQVGPVAGEAGNFRRATLQRDVPESYTVNGVPLMNVVMPFSCQFPRMD